MIWRYKDLTEQYVRPVSEYYNNDRFREVIDNFSKPVLSKFGVTNEVANLILDIVDNMMSNYSQLDYHIIPIANDSEDVRLTALSSYISMMWYKQSYIIEQLTAFGEALKNNNINYDDEVRLTYNNSTSNSSTETKMFGKAISSVSTASNQSMSENSPINADLGDIVTPDNKGVSSASSNKTDTHSGTDTTTIDDTSAKSGYDTRNNSNPDTYKKFLEVVYEYNIYHIVYDVVKMFIYEYNMAI